MKRFILIITALAFFATVQCQTTLIFQSMLPKVVVEPEPLTDVQSLAIWNAIKVYASPGAYIENNSGVYSPNDIKDVYLEAKEILLTFIIPFTRGALLKERVQTDIDADGNPIYTDVYWSPETEKIVYRDYWRANYGGYLLDIVRIYLDYDASAFN